MAVSIRNSFLDPAQFHTVPVYDLLEAAAKAHAGIDQRFIHAIVDRGLVAVSELLRFALDDRTGDPVNLEEDLLAIFRFLKTPEALPFYINCVRDNPEDVSDELIDVIVPFGQAALEPLLKLHDELGEDAAGDVPFLLSALGVQDPRILEILTDRLEYDLGDAALALSVYRDPAAVPALEKMLGEIPEADIELRRELTIAIEASQEGPVPPPVADHPPFDIWELFPEKAPPPVEVLTEDELREMLSSHAAEYRAEAALSFRNRSEYSAKARDQLMDAARQDADNAVRANAWEALGEKADEPAIRKALKTTLADEGVELRVRLGALVGLAGATEDRKVTEFIRKFYDRAETRAKALEAMWRSFDRQFAEVFPKHLDDPDEDIRRAAIWGVGYLSSGSHAGKLASMFHDEDFRSDALFAYALNVPSEISHGRIPGLFRKINEVSGGLTYGEAELVQAALDQRLVMHGLDPYFANPDDEGSEWEEEEEAEEPAPKPVEAAKAGRNEPCPCGSGKKYKKCHGA